MFAAKLDQVGREEILKVFTHLFPIHPFSTPLKTPEKTLPVHPALGTNGLILQIIVDLIHSFIQILNFT